ncbi:esterase-like activity of phytase family protein [Variovorax sp. V213]|uniref:esterase-like activity of phytase family protein n=1 Tax=Variovorax sp. V213 TaxID=3065955 RepID=UPI0034E8BFED
MRTVNSGPIAPASPLRRGLLASAAAAAAGLGGLVGCGSPVIPSATAVRLRRVAEAYWPHRLNIQGTTAGGLSGIDYDTERSEYILLSDDRSDMDPARFYTAQWPAPWVQPPEPKSVVQLQRPGGGPWLARRRAEPRTPVPDPEALRLRPGAGTLLWTSEGDVARGFGPAFYESARDGRLLREFALPAMFNADVSQRRGPRDNLGLEGLALTPDGRHAWLAMENALIQDGPLPTTKAPGGPCRLTRMDLETGQATRQIAYVPDAIPLRPLIPGSYADNGISEVLMLDADRMLVLERAYATGAGNSLRLYEIDTRDATDVLESDTLAAGNHRPAAKTLVADFAQLGLSLLDNTEGMCWGPALPDGKRMLMVVSDDNFNPLQTTQFAAFEYTDRP